MLWHAMPPELNTARLLAGAGEAPALQAASGWQALAAALAEQAEELAANLVFLGQSWTGSGSERALTATTPMVIWLRNAAELARERALQATAQAAAYAQALAMTPSLLEILANHITHAVLAATNFLGINTVPISTNETDYFVRLWNQAATAMDIYQAQTTINTVFDKLEPMKAILGQDLGQVTNTVGQLATASSNQIFGAGELPIQPISGASGSLLQLFQPLQAATSLLGLGSGMSGMGSQVGQNLGTGLETQVGLVGANPLSNHPLAGGSGASTGAGLLRAVSLPGAGGTLTRTPLMGALLDKPADPLAQPIGAGAGPSTTSGLAPMGGGALGPGATAGDSSQPRPATQATPTQPREAADDAEDHGGWDDEDDW
ncbi:PPE family protein [Mycobacterium basiliense]|nr:PPE family protein [Mycobacterium basiliense]